jgi:hypothetical protein
MLLPQDIATLKALPVVEESWVILLQQIIADANNEGWTVNLQTNTREHSPTHITTGFFMVITDHEKNRFEISGSADKSPSESTLENSLVHKTWSDMTYQNSGMFEIAATGKKIYKLDYKTANPEAAWNFFRSVQPHLTAMGELRKAYMKSQH